MGKKKGNKKSGAASRKKIANQDAIIDKKAFLKSDLTSPKQVNIVKDELPVVEDPRFAAVHVDPRFKPIKKDTLKVKVDKRFKKLIQGEEEFQSGPAVDKYGRLVRGSKREELEQFYEFEDSDEESTRSGRSDNEQGESQTERLYSRARGAGLSSSDESDDGSVQSDDGSVINDEEPLVLGDDKDDLEEEIFDIVLDRKDVPLGDATKRFAAVNMDWDHIKAGDLFKVFDSVKPQGGAIISVTVYPSEFGKKRMAHEEQYGPKIEGMESVPRDDFKEVEEEESSDEEFLKDDDGQDFSAVALRKYQLGRLRYYYAVVECDSVRTAQHVFQQCDGAEFESSNNFFDLRFIPVETSFDDEPRDAATASAIDYRPSTTFESKALQHTNVRLTWDEDDPDRMEVTRKRLSYKELKDMDFKSYIASDSDSDDGNGDTDVTKYRALLGLGANEKSEGTKESLDDNSSDSDVVGDMEITFTPGLSEAAEHLMRERAERKKLENETTIEKYQRKERDRRNKRKEKLRHHEDEDPVPGVDNDDYTGFNDPFFDDEMDMEEVERLEVSAENGAASEDPKKILTKKEKLERKKRRKQMETEDREEQEEEERGFAVNVEDSRFQSVFADAEFAIDPTNPHFRATEGMKEILEEKRKRPNLPVNSKGTSGNPLAQPSNTKEKELSSLVEAVKRKAKQAGKTIEENGFGRRKKLRSG